MLRRALLPLAVVVATASSAACQKTATVGSFTLDVPDGWRVKRDDSHAVEVKAKNGSWSWFVLSFVADAKTRSMRYEQILEVFIVEILHDGDEFEVTKTGDWSTSVLNGMLLGGVMRSHGLELPLLMLVANTGDNYVIAIGMRMPDASSFDDATAGAMLRTLRLH